MPEVPRQLRMTVVVYSRPGCHLCDEAVSVLEKLRCQFAFGVDVRDVDVDPAIWRKYGFAIPVVIFPNGAILTAPISPDDVACQVANLPRHRRFFGLV